MINNRPWAVEGAVHGGEQNPPAVLPGGGRAASRCQHNCSTRTSSSRASLCFGAAPTRGPCSRILHQLFSRPTRASSQAHPHQPSCLSAHPSRHAQFCALPVTAPASGTVTLPLNKPQKAEFLPLHLSQEPSQHWETENKSNTKTQFSY